MCGLGRRDELRGGWGPVLTRSLKKLGNSGWVPHPNIRFRLTAPDTSS